MISCEEASETVEVMKWHKTTLSFEGPETSEEIELNPFTDYRLLVTFSNGNKQYVVPGFYAGDGNAAETSATGGNVWQVRFRPDETGTWNYEVSFRQGDMIAIADDPEAGEPTAFDGQRGTLQVIDSDKQYPDFRARGRLEYVGDRYLKFAETGEYFLKAGADSPENFLAFQDFDSTYRYVSEAREGEAATSKATHQYAEHVQDWNEGDPTWQGGKGKAIIGALNYLAEQGMNSVYFLTMNIEGDGKDVWPYLNHQERTRFDVSKLDQWEKVFDHMGSLGLMLHIVTQETENEKLLDDGEYG